MKVGNWEIEDSVLTEQWAAWEFDWGGFPTTLTVTPRGWESYIHQSGTMKITHSILANCTESLDSVAPHAKGIRDAILDGTPPVPNVGCLDWDVVDNKGGGHVVRYYANFPASGKLWYQGMNIIQGPSMTLGPINGQVQEVFMDGFSFTGIASKPAAPAPKPYKELIHTQKFNYWSCEAPAVYEQTLQAARSKMATRRSYPTCKCCGQLVSWQTLDSRSGDTITIRAYLACPEHGLSND